MVFKYIFCFIVSGLRDNTIQELFCWGQHTLVSFTLNVKIIICYMHFILNKTHTHVALLQENNERISLSSRFNFIMLYEVSRVFYLQCRCTRTDTFVNNRNKFSNLSALVAQTLWACVGIVLGSGSHLKIWWHFWRCFLLSWRVNSPSW